MVVELSDVMLEVEDLEIVDEVEFVEVVAVELFDVITDVDKLEAVDVEFAEVGAVGCRVDVDVLVVLEVVVELPAAST